MRRCYPCPLNLGKYCWGFRCPRDQWRGRRGCRGFDNEEAYELFHAWQKDSHVKTRKQLRQGVFRKKKTEPHYNGLLMQRTLGSRRRIR